jgi:hypothetical protein
MAVVSEDGFEEKRTDEGHADFDVDGNCECVRCDDDDDVDLV